MSINIRITPEVQAVIDQSTHHAYIVNMARYPTGDDRVLAMFDDKHVVLYPEAEVLAKRGFNIESIALALKADAISPEALADIVDHVARKFVTIEVANRRLLNLVPRSARRHIALTDSVLEGIGLESELVNICLARETITEEVLREMVSNVCRGWLPADDANTGLSHLAECVPVQMAA